MVSKKKAFIAAGLSAIAVGTVHYLSHKIFSVVIPEYQVMAVGTVVVLTVFGIGYFGMIYKN